MSKLQNSVLQNSGILQNSNILQKLFNKYIGIDSDRYTYIGTKNADYKYFKREYGKPTFVDISQNRLSLGSSNKNTVIFLNDSSFEKPADIVNNIDGSFIINVPSSFKFNQFIKNVNLEHYDIYRNHANNDTYFICFQNKN